MSLAWVQGIVYNGSLKFYLACVPAVSIYMSIRI